jgi:hypothetical protein
MPVQIKTWRGQAFVSMQTLHKSTNAQTDIAKGLVKPIPGTMSHPIDQLQDPISQTTQAHRYLTRNPPMLSQEYGEPKVDEVGSNREGAQGFPQIHDVGSH